MWWCNSGNEIIIQITDEVRRCEIVYRVWIRNPLASWIIQQLNSTEPQTKGHGTKKNMIFFSGHCYFVKVSINRVIKSSFDCY